MSTYIIGHTKPDTDAVVAAMALEYLYQNTPSFGYPDAKAVITDPLNPETTYLFDRFGVNHPQQITAKDIRPQDKIVLVDHNEASQRLEGINPEQITEIVDHHKANLDLPQPIFLTFKAWGSTSTIIYHLMQTLPEKPLNPDKTLATLMLAAILSDTVGFKSSTTTPKDKEVGEALLKLTDITDLNAFTLDIFKAKSNISDLTDEQIVRNDYKVFQFAQTTYIDQLETVEQDKILATKKDNLLAAMQSVKDSEQVDLLFVAITDILKVNTKLLILGEAEAQVAQTAFGGEVKDHVLDIGPKMSRKKEIAPAIEKVLQA